MKRNYHVLLFSLCIMLALSFFLASSYGIYMYSTQTAENIASSSCFEITFVDSNDIDMQNTVPLSDSEAQDLVPYTFTIKNICSYSASYDINLETQSGTTIDRNYIKYQLNDSESKILGSSLNNTFVTPNAIDSVTLLSGTLTPNLEKTFNLRLWIDENTTIEQSANKIFNSKVVVVTSLNRNYNDTILLPGKEFNKALRFLSGDSENTVNSVTYSIDGVTLNDKIIKILKSDQAPTESDNYVVVSTDESAKEAYAWYESDTSTIKIYSENDILFANKDMSYALSGFSALTEFNLPINTSKSENIEGLFMNDSSLTALDVSSFDSSNVVNMAGTFAYMSKMQNLNLGNLDTSKVTTMTHMFDGLKIITELNLGSNFDTSNVEDMSYMFRRLNALITLDLGTKFNTSKVKDMQLMFAGLNRCTSLNLGDNFDTSNVTNMEWMFNGLNRFSKDNNLNLGNKFNTSNVRSMSGMFSYYCGGSLDLSGFDTSNVTNMYNMFVGSYNMEVLDLSSFDTSKVGNMERMFYNMSALKTIYVSDKFTTNVVWGSTEMFANDKNLVGGAGTKYNSNITNSFYARLDNPNNGKPGYFTLKTS